MSSVMASFRGWLALQDVAQGIINAGAAVLEFVIADGIQQLEHLFGADTRNYLFFNAHCHMVENFSVTNIAYFLSQMEEETERGLRLAT